MGSCGRRTTRVTNAVKNTAPTRTRLKGIIGSVLRRRINKSEKQLRPQVLQYLEASSDRNAHAYLDLPADGLTTAVSSSSDQHIPPSCWHYSAPAPSVSSRLDPEAKNGGHWWHHPATLQTNDPAPSIPDFTAHCTWLSDPRSLCTSHEVLNGRFEDHARNNELTYNPGSTECPAGIGYSSMRGTPTVLSPVVLSREATPHQRVQAEVEAAMAGCSDKAVSVADDKLSKTERGTETTHQADADRPKPVVTCAGARREQPWNSGAAHAVNWAYEELTRVDSAASKGFARAKSMAPDDPFHVDWLGIIGCTNRYMDEIEAELEDDFWAIEEQAQQN